MDATGRLPRSAAVQRLPSGSVIRHGCEHKHALDQLPPSARPVASHGALSYTIRDSGGAIIEVLLAKRAFYLKSGLTRWGPAHSKLTGVRRHVAWAKHDTVASAFAAACHLTGYGTD